MSELQIATAHRGTRNVALTTGLAIFLLIVAIAIFAPFITGYDPYAQDTANQIASPVWYGWLYNDPTASWAHPLGTDKLGRDYWTRLVYGARISLLVGFSTIIISGAIGTTLGIVAGYFRGWTDQIISLLVSARLCVPIVLIALALVSLFPSSLFSVILVLGLLLWDRFAIVVRAATLQARNTDYVAAARAAGCSNLRIIWQEIFPNIYEELLVVAAIEMANAILIEASLSFLGLGIKPPLPSWGLMLADAKDQLFFSPWLITLPGCAILILVLAINLIGNGLRHGLHAKY